MNTFFRNSLPTLALIALITFVFWGLSWTGSRPAPSSSIEVGSDNPAKAFMMKLVHDHPDPRVSRDLYEEWRRAEIWVYPDTLELGHAGSFRLESAMDMEKLFGRRPPRDPQPTLVLSEAKFQAAQRNPDLLRSLQKTISHEYRHYLQWKRGEFFQKEFDANELNRSCSEIWNREFPLYLEDCFLVEQWWPGQPSVFPDGRCVYKDDPPRFGVVMFRLLAERAPECGPIFRELAANVQPN